MKSNKTKKLVTAISLAIVFASPAYAGVIKVADSSIADSKVADSKVADSNIADSKVADSKVADSNTADSNTADSNTADSKAIAYTADSGAMSTLSLDASTLSDVDDSSDNINMSGTVNSVEEVKQRAQVHSQMKGELEVLKLQLQLDTVQEQLKALHERSKSAAYAKQLKKMESYYEGLREADKKKFSEALASTKLRMTKDLSRRDDHELNKMKEINKRLNDQILKSFNNEMNLKAEIRELKKKKVEKVTYDTEVSTSVSDLSHVYVTRIDDIFGKKRAQVYFKNHMRWLKIGEPVISGITVVGIKDDEILVKHDNSGTVKSIPLVAVEFAESMSGMDDLIMEKPVAAKADARPVRRQLRPDDGRTVIRQQTISPPTF